MTGPGVTLSMRPGSVTACNKVNRRLLVLHLFLRVTNDSTVSHRGTRPAAAELAQSRIIRHACVVDAGRVTVRQSIVGTEPSFGSLACPTIRCNAVEGLDQSTTASRLLATILCAKSLAQRQ